MTAVIEVRGLRKEYTDLRRRSIVALDGLDLDIPGPGVYGLLGPNGSGKTTTIRCLLGLVRPSAGSVRVLGTDLTGLPGVAHRIGALVEGPKFVGTMSARANLEFFATMSGIDRRRIDDVLDIVGLEGRAGDRVEAYSLGMTQRLGIAAALLNDPELVILDEPTNGLDPAGIADVRRLMSRMADEGRAVLFASHQLHEVQQVCDRVVVFDRGRSVASGSLAEVLGDNTGIAVRVEVADVVGAAAALRGLGYEVSTDPLDQLVVRHVDGVDAAEVNLLLVGAGHPPRMLVQERRTLEDVFLALTATEQGTISPQEVV